MVIITNWFRYTALKGDCSKIYKKKKHLLNISSFQFLPLNWVVGIISVFILIVSETGLLLSIEIFPVLSGMVVVSSGSGYSPGYITEFPSLPLTITPRDRAASMGEVAGGAWGERGDSKAARRSCWGVAGSLTASLSTANTNSHQQSNIQLLS